MRAGKTQEEASTDRSTSTVSRWESGKHEPSWEALDAYAHELGQPIVLRFGPEPNGKEAAPSDVTERLERVERLLDQLVAGTPGKDRTEMDSG